MTSSTTGGASAGWPEFAANGANRPRKQRHAGTKGLTDRTIERLRQRLSKLPAPAASKAGVHRTLEVWPRMIHVWQWYAPVLDEGRAAVKRIAEFIRAALARPGAA